MVVSCVVQLLAPIESLHVESVVTLSVPPSDIMTLDSQPRRAYESVRVQERKRR